MKEKEINRRFKSSRLCFFSPLKILQVTELAADVSSRKHLLELLVVDHELRSSSMKTLSISLRGPAAKQGDEKLVYRLIQLFFFLNIKAWRPGSFISSMISIYNSN